MMSIVAAVAANGVIGSNGSIPWDIPEDRAYFRRLTTGGVVIMGRRTYESIGRPLPERYNIVVSGKAGFRGKLLCTVKSLDEALETGRRYLHRSHSDAGIYLCGGAEIYRKGLDSAERLYLTELYDSFDGDVYFPNFDREEYELLAVDDHPELRLRFCVYERRKMACVR